MLPLEYENQQINSVSPNNSDLYQLSVNSLVSQLRAVEGNEKTNFDDVESMLYSKLFLESLNYAMSELDPVNDKLFLDVLHSSKSAGEVLSKISLESQANQQFALSLAYGITKTYIELALEYNVVAEEKITSITIN